MQEILEKTLKDVSDMYDDAIRHTDVVSLLKDIKLQRALAENSRLRAEHLLEKYERERVIDPSDEFLEDEVAREASDFARIVETFDYVIDVIESGKFTKEYHDL
jgi:hypothetical protein